MERSINDIVRVEPGEKTVDEWMFELELSIKDCADELWCGGEEGPPDRLERQPAQDLLLLLTEWEAARRRQPGAGA